MIIREVAYIICTLLITMFGLLHALYEEYFGSPCYNICILGIQETGKSLLFNSIKQIIQPAKTDSSAGGTVIFQYKPTVGLNVVKYKNEKDQFIVWDLGGRQNIRKIWQSYYPQCHGVIYIINTNVSEGIQVLKTVLSHQQMARIPVCVIATDLSKKEILDSTLRRSEWIRDHRYMVYGLQLARFKTSQFTVKHLLHWLYFSISQLHEELKE